MHDVLELIANYIGMTHISTLAFVSKDAKLACRDFVRFRSLYAAVLHKMHTIWSNRPEIEKNGLCRTAEAFLGGKILSSTDICRIQDMATNPSLEIARRMRLGSYTRQNGTTMDLTVGSVLKTILHPPICAYFEGLSFSLRIYIKTHGQTLLPCCCDGQFYSWGYVDRMSGPLASFADTERLTPD